jgi:hypothetical protein
MDRASAKAILKRFDSAHALLRGRTFELQTLPSDLRIEVERISQMKSFEKELSQFLADYALPPLTRHRSDGWTHFLHLYAKVIEDIPLRVSVPVVGRVPKQGRENGQPKLISHVTVHCELARETIKHDEGEEVLFKVTWTIHDKNGQSGDIFILKLVFPGTLSPTTFLTIADLIQTLASQQRFNITATAYDAEDQHVRARTFDAVDDDILAHRKTA